MSGDIFSCHTGGGYCHSVGRGQACSIAQDSPATKGYLAPDVSSAEGEKASQSSDTDLGVAEKMNGVTCLSCLVPSRPRLSGSLKRGSRSHFSSRAEAPSLRSFCTGDARWDEREANGGLPSLPSFTLSLLQRLLSVC